MCKSAFAVTLWKPLLALIRAAAGRGGGCSMPAFRETPLFFSLEWRGAPHGPGWDGCACLHMQCGCVPVHVNERCCFRDRVANAPFLRHASCLHLLIPPSTPTPCSLHCTSFLPVLPSIAASKLTSLCRRPPTMDVTWQSWWMSLLKVFLRLLIDWWWGNNFTVIFF